MSDLKPKCDNCDSTETELRKTKIAVFNLLNDLNIEKKIVEQKVEIRTKELSEAKEHTEAIIENLAYGIVEYTKNYLIEKINREAELLLVVGRDAVLGEVISINDAKFPHLSRVIYDDDSKISPFEAMTRELTIFVPTERCLQITTVPLRFSGGEGMRYIALIRDTTREKMVARSKDEFVAVAAHQMRTPLSIMKWALNGIIEGNYGALLLEQRDILKDAFETNEKTISLINDLLMLARMEDGKFDYTFSSHDLSSMVVDIVKRYSFFAKGKEITLTYSKPEAGSSLFMFDSTKIELAIHILLDNAMTYTPKHGSVSISLRFEKGWAIISVKDSGIGISEEDKARLFGKFFRAKNAISVSPNGSGIGLFLAKNIVEKHKGNIVVESKLKEGSIVTIRLPLEGLAIPKKGKMK